ncbi:MAG: hydroxymethylglutaryl-CoA lyase [Planctomycetes bacterium]|nr:hydroxymethylglutaryl-CoA lyase [Planctomycetota bacterium]
MLERVTICEVGPRDGLQNVAERIPTEAKIAFIDALSDSGLTYIEASAFVSAKAIPQLSDAAEVYSAITRRDGIAYPALIPSAKYLERATSAGVREIAIFTAASETFNQRNIRATIDESFERFRELMPLAKSAGLSVRGYVSTAIACPYEGAIKPSKVVEVTSRLFDLGVDEVSVGDTIGAGTPAHVATLLEALSEEFERDRIALHFHDTYGMALVNVLTALSEGYRKFDTSAGGLGGCPYAPGASGNLATEDLIFMLGGTEFDTGVDLQKIVAASKIIEDALGRPLPSKVLRAMSSARPAS